jgi:hypothetical protein
MRTTLNRSAERAPQHPELVFTRRRNADVEIALSNLARSYRQLVQGLQGPPDVYPAEQRGHQ